MSQKVIHFPTSDSNRLHAKYINIVVAMLMSTTLGHYVVRLCSGNKINILYLPKTRKIQVIPRNKSCFADAKE